MTNVNVFVEPKNVGNRIQAARCTKNKEKVIYFKLLKKLSRSLFILFNSAGNNFVLILFPLSQGNDYSLRAHVQVFPYTYTTNM
jgi:hypothetical protein